MTMKPLRPITLDDLRGQPGFSRAASNALVAPQPPTVMKALVMHGVGLKTTKRLLGRLIKHARCYWLLLAESQLTRRLFGSMVQRIGSLPLPAG